MEIKMRIPDNQRYSEAFRHQVVREFERGGITKDGLKDTHQRIRTQVERFTRENSGL